jgi:hypothetical protein
MNFITHVGNFFFHVSWLPLLRSFTRLTLAAFRSYLKPYDNISRTTARKTCRIEALTLAEVSRGRRRLCTVGEDPVCISGAATSSAALF